MVRVRRCHGQSWDPGSAENACARVDLCRQVAPRRSGDPPGQASSLSATPLARRPCPPRCDPRTVRALGSPSQPLLNQGRGVSPRPHRGLGPEKHRGSTAPTAAEGPWRACSGGGAERLMLSSLFGRGPRKALGRLPGKCAEFGSGVPGCGRTREARPGLSRLVLGLLPGPGGPGRGPGSGVVASGRACPLTPASPPGWPSSPSSSA